MKNRIIFFLMLLFLLGCTKEISETLPAEENITTAHLENETDTVEEIIPCETIEECREGKTCYLGFCIAEEDVAAYIPEAEEETVLRASETWNGTLYGTEYPYEEKSECGDVTNHYTILVTVPSSLVAAVQNTSNYAKIPADDTEGSVSGWSLVYQETSTPYCDVEGSVFSGMSITVDASLTKGEPVIRLLTRNNGSEFFETSTWRRYNTSNILENGSKEILGEGSNVYNGFLLVPKLISDTTVSGSWRTASAEPTPWEPQGTFMLTKQEGS